MADKKFAIRFSVEDMEKVRAALKTMGTDGAAALRAIERQSRDATPAMKAVDTAARDIRAEFDRWADRIPVVGGMLKGLGPAGTAAAAGIAALGVGLAKLWSGGRESMKWLGELVTQSENLSLSIEGWQAIQAAAFQEGVKTERLVPMLQALELNASRASAAQGKFKTALEGTHPELVRQVAAARNQEERWDAVARAIQSTEDHTERVRIATAAFGKEGVSLIRVLQQSDSGVASLVARYREMGLVIDEHTVRAVDKLDEQYDMLARRVDINVKKAFIDLAPVIVDVTGALASASDAVGGFFEGFKPIAQRSSATLEDEIDRLAAQHKQLLGLVYAARANPLDVIHDTTTMSWRAGMDLGRNQLAALEAKLAGVRKEISDRQDELMARARAKAAPPSGSGDVTDPAEEARKQAEAERLAAEAARLRATQEREAIEIRAGLGDWTGKLAQEEERLNALVTAGALSRESANARLANYRAELDGSKAAIDRWAAAVQATETPVERARRELGEFIDEAMLIPERGPVFQAALRMYADGLREAERAADEATPVFQAAAKAKALIAAAGEAAMSTDDRVAAYARELDAIAATRPDLLSWEQAARAVAAYRDELERTTGTSREASLEMRVAAATLHDIFDENMNSLEDFGRMFSRVVRDMVIEWMMANQRMASSQGLGEWMARAFGSLLGGAAAAGAGARSGGDVSGGGLPSVVTPRSVGVFHTGTASVGTSVAATRRMAMASFIGAQRFHDGLAPDEFPAVLQKRERVLSVLHNERLVSAVERSERAIDMLQNERGVWAMPQAPAPTVELHFHGAPSQPEVRETTTPGGGKRIDVSFGEMVGKAIAGGAADKAMRSRYGVGRAMPVG